MCTTDDPTHLAFCLHGNFQVMTLMFKPCSKFQRVFWDIRRGPVLSQNLVSNLIYGCNICCPKNLPNVPTIAVVHNKAFQDSGPAPCAVYAGERFVEAWSLSTSK